MTAYRLLALVVLLLVGRVLMSLPPPAPGAPAAPPPGDDPAAASLLNRSMFGLVHLLRASPGFFGGEGPLPGHDRVASLFDGVPRDASWTPSLRAAALKHEVRVLRQSPGGGGGDGGGGNYDDTAEHANAPPAQRVRGGGRSDKAERASADDASRSRILDLARPGVLLRENLLCEFDGCTSPHGVCCTGPCCRLTGMVMCFDHDLETHMKSPSNKRCVLPRRSPAGSFVLSLAVDQFVVDGAIITRPLPAPEASVCPTCGSSLSQPKLYDLSKPIKRVDADASYLVGRVLRWTCAAKSSAGGVCGTEWGRGAVEPQLVGATSLTPERTHTIIGNDVLTAHVHQRAAASHGQPAEELWRLLGRLGAWLPLASLRRWLWAHTMWEVHVWGMLQGALHACIVCADSPRAVFVDGCFSPSRRATAGGWVPSGWSVVGSTAMDGWEPRLRKFDAAAHAGGRALMDNMRRECGAWGAGDEVAGA